MKTVVSSPLSQLLKHGIAEIQFELPKNLIDSVFQYMRLFESEEKEFLERIKFDYSESERQFDTGYISYEPNEKYDHKAYFHYRPHMKEYLRELEHKRFVFYDPFFEICDTLYTACLYHALNIAFDIAKKFPQYNLRRLLHEARYKHVLRLLHYKGVKGNVFAKEHQDKCFLTPAPYESHPGLVFVDGEQEVLYKRKPGITPVFFGKTASALSGGEATKDENGYWLYQGGALKAIKHKVVLEEKTKERFAIVFFLHINQNGIDMYGNPYSIVS